MFSIPKNLEELAHRGKPAIAQVLSMIEADTDNPQLIHLLDQAHETAKGQVLGLTGPPGVGKSTLSAAMIDHYRKSNQTVGVIAVDPSSRVSGGALLGDRIRLNAAPDDEGVFIRSFSNQGRLGGLSQATYAAMVIMRAQFDLVIVETVGVGQSESAIMDIADTVILCIQPGSGDSIQFMKSGIMELPHIIVVTKADMGTSARIAFADVEGALGLRTRTANSHPVKVAMISASTGEGMETLLTMIAQHFSALEQAGDLNRDRCIKAGLWIRDVILTRFGEEGWHRAQPLLGEFQELPVFTRKIAILDKLQVATCSKLNLPAILG